MKKILALLLSVAMLAVPMTAMAERVDAGVDYVYDKITITGEFGENDAAEDKLATLLVLDPDKIGLIEDVAADAESIVWADQAIVSENKVTFTIDTFEMEDGENYSFYISAPGVATTFEGNFTYNKAAMEDALIKKLNDSNLRAAGIDEFIRVYAKARISEIDAEIVEKYEALKNPMNAASDLVKTRPFDSLTDFVNDLKAAVKSNSGNGSGSGSGSGSGGGSVGGGGGFSAGAGVGLIAPVETNPFLDIANSYWGKDAIINLYNKGVVKGNNGYFRPDNTITRAEFVQMVVMAFGFGMNGEAANFADVADSDWFAYAVKTANANGVVNGTSATTFSPLANITRQDMMTILYNAANAKGINLTTGDASFTDADSISGYAQNAVAAMVGSKVVSGYTDGSVKPLNNASRAEAAAMLSRLLEVK